MYDAMNRTNALKFLCACLVGLLSLLLAETGFAQIKSSGLPQIEEGYTPPQQIDGSQNPGANAADLSAPLNQELTSSNSQGEKVFAALFQELDNMIPGDFEAGSPVKKAIEDAVTAFQLQDANRVRSILVELAEQNPEFPPANLMLAALSYAVQDADSGLILLENAAVENPEYPGIYSAFARLALNQGRISDALAMLEKCQRKIDASQLGQSTKDFFSQQCRDGLIDVAMRQKRYDDARKYLQTQREALPENPKVLMVSAELEFQQDDIPKCLEYLQIVKTKFPQSRMPESIIAGWYNRSNKPKEAEEWIRKSAEKYPDLPQVQLEYASWAFDREDFPTASSAIIKAEKSGSESLFSRNLKGKIAFSKQSYGVAEAHFQAIAAKQPNNFDAVNMYALSLIESDNSEKQQLAREIAMRNFRALPDNKVAQAALGYIELKLGQVDQAKSILARVAQIPGSAPEIDYFFAMLLAKLGETEKAKMVLEAALKHEGIFLYRSSAKQLLNELGTTESLPEPGK